MSQEAPARPRDQPPRTPTPSQPARRSGGLRQAVLPWPLAAVLAAQTALSLSLVWSNTAASSEAQSLWAGRLEWAHWLHGAPLPALSSYFPGAPGIYPPLGALADSLGHLAGARVLSLCLMLAATALLHATTSRLFGERAALFAAALWAVCTPVLKLGAFATADTFAIFLVTLTVWVGVRAGSSRRHGEVVLATAFVLAFANVTAYATIVMDPAVLTLVWLSWVPSLGRKQAWISAAWLTGAAVVLLTLIASRMRLWQGIAATLPLSPTHHGFLLVVQSSWAWLGLIWVLALVGLVISTVRIRKSNRTAGLAVLVFSVFLVPLEQAALRSETGLDSHVAVGAWLAAMAAGFGLSVLVRHRFPGPPWAIAGACAAALVIPAVNGLNQAEYSFHSWPNSAAFVRVFSKLARQTEGNFLVEDSPIAKYAIPQGRDWRRWEYLNLNRPVRSLSALSKQEESFGAALHRDRFALVALTVRTSQVSLVRSITSQPSPAIRQSLLRAATGLSGDRPGVIPLAMALAADYHFRIVATAPDGKDRTWVMWRS